MDKNFDYIYIEELIRRALEKEIADDEHKLLLLFFKYADQESVDHLLQKAFEQHKTAPVLQNAEEHFAQIMGRAKIVRELPSRKLYRFLRYAAAVLLLLSIPILFYKKELGDSMRYTYVEKENSVISDSITIIPHIQKSNNAVKLILSDAATKSYTEQSDQSELQLADMGVRIVQQDNEIRYEEIKAQAPIKEIYHEIEVPYGRTFDVQLLDGTRIKLNSGSHIRYPLRISKDQMLVTLRGEAYFDVAKRSGRQFIVQIPAHNAVKKHQIEVLGTRFNIKAYSSDDESITTLLTGAIQASGLGEQPVLLQPNQQLLVNQEVAVSEANVANATAWLDNTFYFENATLDALCKEISRWYGVEIAYDRSLEDTKFYVNISRKQPLVDMISILKSNPNMAVKQTNNKIYIKRNY